MADLCQYPAAHRDKIIRDVLFINCSSKNAKDKIIHKDPEVGPNDVIQILQMEDTSEQASQNMNSSQETAFVHYARYD